MSHVESELDLTNAGRKLWLVKVPKFVAKRWEKTPDNIDIGTLALTKYPKQEAKISLTLSDAVLNLKEFENEQIPKEYKLSTTSVKQQTIGIFSHVTSSTTSNTNQNRKSTEKIVMEGQIVQKLDCKPLEFDDCYMKLKLDEIRRYSMPQKKIKNLDKLVQNYKPVSDHKNNIEYREKKKAEKKKVRENKDIVLDMLFAAFEKHQYYNIKDLVKITKQPIVYLKEILHEFCDYNTKHPHKNMWELKPEYRYYDKDTSNKETK